ncbi:MAG: aldehyde dehydrogenase [Planctomycetota bacterium]|nr:aldehyde dehydrogenase [Planctomycetota bacterium]
MLTLANYIRGELVPPAEGKYLDSFEPATGKLHARVPDSGAPDVEAAVAAAREAFPAWAATPAQKRSRLLLELARRIEERAGELARDESVDSGKTVTQALEREIPRAVSNFRFFGTAILHARTDAHRMDDFALNVTLRKPRGVAGLISPWNLPLYLLTWKIAPALATGNTVVAKPSELTPLTAFRLSEICREAGLPPGVLNIVHGTGARAGEALVQHPQVPTLSFTGGTQTGRRIAETAARGFKKLALEMGGKNPTVICADAEPEAALDGAVRAAFSNQGQICLCGSRVFVEASIYDDFAARFVARARQLKIGDPLLPETEQGALVSRGHRDKVLGCVKLAREEGGTIRCGGGAPEDLPERCRGGYFVQPTVITDLPPDCRTNTEEIFGPVVTLAPFTRDEEALTWANGTPYGLAASVWTRDLARAQRFADALDAGTVWINCWLVRDLRVPFGGMKQSGVGREGGDEALRFFTEPKNVCVKLGAP